MNQKSIIAILGVVVVILIGTTMYFATINKPVAPAPKVVQQPVPMPTPEVQSARSTTPTVQQAQEITYVSSKYGFSVKLPSNWKGYNVEEFTQDFNPGYYSIAFNAPLPAGADERMINGHIFTVVVAEVIAYEAYKKRCENGDGDPGCPQSDNVLAKTQKYVFEYKDTQDFSDAMKDKDLNFEQVKKGFNLIK